MKYLVLCLALVSCSGDRLGTYELLDDIRVLSFKAEPPEVNPGDTVTLTPLLSDVPGQGRSLRYSVEACVDPGIKLGADPTCEGREDRVVIVEDERVTGLVAPEYTGVAPGFSVTVPTDILQGRNASESHNGVAYLVFYTLRSDGKVILTSYKNVWVSTRTTKNTSPTLSEIRVNGESPGSLPTGEVFLSAKFDSEPKETYESLSLLGTKTTREEEIVTSWFISDGSLDDARTAREEGTKWTTPTVPVAGRKVVVVGVTRDGRGGESFQIVLF